MIESAVLIGNAKLTRDQLALVPTPPGTATHKPNPHYREQRENLLPRCEGKADHTSSRETLSFITGRLGHFWQAHVGHSNRAPKQS